MSSLSTRGFQESFLKNNFYLKSKKKRALGVFRIIYALAILGDLLDRVRDLRAHYTDL